MIAKVEAVQSYLENVTFQMCNMTYREQSKHLAGQIGFLKMLSTRVAGEIADEAVQIFGGRGLTKTGMGRFIEQFQRTQKYVRTMGLTSWRSKRPLGTFRRSFVRRGHC